MSNFYTQLDKVQFVTQIYNETNVRTFKKIMSDATGIDLSEAEVRAMRNNLTAHIKEIEAETYLNHSFKIKDKSKEDKPKEEKSKEEKSKEDKPKEEKSKEEKSKEDKPKEEKSKEKSKEEKNDKDEKKQK